MKRVFAYLFSNYADRFAPQPDRKALADYNRQLKQAQDLFTKHLEPHGYQWVGAFSDWAETSNVSIWRRPFGQEVCELPGMGDVVLVTREGFRDTRDFRWFCEHANEIEVTVITLDGEFVSSRPGEKLALGILRREQFINRRRRSLQMKRIKGALKARGRQVNQEAGYGFRWAGRAGSRYRVVDHEERVIMARIVAMRDEEGMSWPKIAVRLLYEKVEYAPGREWSQYRCARAYKAEKLLRAAEGDREVASA